LDIIFRKYDKSVIIFCFYLCLLNSFQCSDTVGWVKKTRLNTFYCHVSLCLTHNIARLYWIWMYFGLQFKSTIQLLSARMITQFSHFAYLTVCLYIVNRNRCAYMILSYAVMWCSVEVMQYNWKCPIVHLLLVFFRNYLN